MTGRAAGRYFFFFIALAGGFAILSSTMSKTPALPLFSKFLGASPEEIGWIVVASTIPGILISLPAGALSDFLGKRRIILASLVIFATAPFLYLLVHQVWQLIAVRFYHGFATAMFGTVAMAAIAQRYGQDRARKLSTFSSATIVGRSIAPFLGGFLISLASFHMVYLACGIAGLLALAVGAMLPLEEKAAASSLKWPDFLGSLGAVVRDRNILLTSVVEACQYLTFGAVEAFLALYAASLGIPAWTIGMILGVQLVGVIFVKPAMGAISDRVGRKRVIVPGLLAGAVSIFLMPRLTGAMELGALSLLFGVGFATVTSSTSALVADFTRNGQYGSSMGVLRTIMDIGQSIGPVLTGWMVARHGYGPAFDGLALILCGAAILLAVWVRGH